MSPILANTRVGYVTNQAESRGAGSPTSAPGGSQVAGSRTAAVRISFSSGNLFESAPVGGLCRVFGLMT